MGISIDNDQLWSLITYFLRASTWNESEKILLAHPELLSIEAESILGFLIDSVTMGGNSNIIGPLQESKDLIKRCRELGIEKAIKEKADGTSKPPLVRIAVMGPRSPTQEAFRSSDVSELDSIIHELLEVSHPNEIKRRMELCNRGLKLVSQKENSSIWAILHFELANCLAKNSSDDLSGNIENAFYNYQQALKIFTYQASPENWANIQLNLGNLFRSRIIGDHADNIEHSIWYYSQALKVFTNEHSSNKWAYVHYNMGDIFMGRIKGDRAENLEQAIKSYEQALQIYTMQDSPQEWAMIQKNLGSAFYMRVKGDSAENIEQAIEHYIQALQIYSYEKSPYNWAEIQNYLGNIFRERIKGDRAKNIENAIIHNQQALQVFNYRSFPKMWALTLNDLSIDFLERIYGEKAENIEKTIDCLQQSMKVFIDDPSNEKLALIRINLANAFIERIHGNKAENIENAIQLLQLALQVCTCKNYRDLWMNIQITLGNAYKNRIRDDRAENLEKAIESYLSAKSAIATQHYSRKQADIDHNLGGAFRIRIRGNRAKNIEYAIKYHKQALQVYARQTFPEQWAGTQYSLGLCFRDRILENRAENIEQAIDYHQQALRIYTRQAFPEKWAKTLSSLASTLILRIFGDLTENIEIAIHYYEQALEVCTRQAFPKDWANIQNDLGIAFYKRRFGDKTDNSNQAIKHLELALEIHTFEDYPEQWAMTHDDLAIVLSDCDLADRAKNIDLAIDHYHMALQVRTFEAFPEEWASIQINMGSAFRNRINGDQITNQEKAIDYLEQALKVFTLEDYPEKWALVQKGLGYIYKDLLHGDRAENAKRSIGYLKMALKIYEPSSYPEECRDMAIHLGNLYFDTSCWQDASEFYKNAMNASEILYKAAIFNDNKDSILIGNGDLHHRAAFCLAKSNQIKEAVLSLEQNRARAIGDVLSRDLADLERLKDQRIEIFQLFQQASKYVNQLELNEAKTDGRDIRERISLSHELSKAYGALENIVATIRRIPGYDRFLTGLSWDELENIIKILKKPLIYIDNTSAGTVSIIIYADNGAVKIKTIWHNELKYSELRRLLIDLWDGLDSLQADYKYSLRMISNLTKKLWDILMGQLIAALSEEGFKESVIIPTGILSFLPLHAAWTDNDGQHIYALDKITFSYAPSARSMKYVLQMAKNASQDHLLAIDNPLPITMGLPLANSHKEVSSIEAYFPSKEILHNQDATKDKVLKALTRAQVAHFSCHGISGISSENTGLLLANDEIITVSDLFQLRLCRARLATLSACSTGRVNLSKRESKNLDNLSLSLLDEVYSLPTAFIQAGFPGVVASFWPIDDASTALLMSCFYRLWLKDRLSPATALQQSQQWLRDNYDTHPFYWGAFFLTGT